MKITKLKKPLTLVILYLSLPFVLLITSPEMLPLPLLVLPIVLFFCILFFTSLFAIQVIRPAMAKRKSRVIAGLLAALPSLLVILQSIDQLSGRDFLIVIGLWAIMGWYLLKIDFA